jgi:hypothetical protein
MKRRAFLISVIMVAVLLALSFGAATAVASDWTSAPTQIAKAGIGHDYGSWQNSYPWSMCMFNGDLYVGTGRVGCTSAVMSLMSGPMAGGGAGLPGGVPPNDPQPPQLKEFLSADGLSVTDNVKFDAFNAVSRAEIWRYHCGTWQRVFQARMIPSYLGGTAAPYSAAAITGFRGMRVFTDAHGVSALYAAAGGFTFAARQPLMMRSTDGVTWAPVYSPVDPKTQVPLMGRESRALWVHHGKLYVGVGYSGLGGKVAAGAWASSDPTDPSSWTKVIDFPTMVSTDPSDRANTNVVSFASYFGRLYLGTENSSGFQVWRSKVADPMGNGDWKKVVTGGAGMAVNEWAGTMKVFNGWLYVGSMHVPGISGSTQLKGFDLIRISLWDTWQLVIGDPRTAATPWGTRMMTPISGKPSGMGNPLNLYCWSLEVKDGQLYLGTFDLTTMLKLGDSNGQMLQQLLGLSPAQVTQVYAGAGGDLYSTWNGYCWKTRTLTGFGNQYDYGFRNIVAAPCGLYFGLSDPFYGCAVWQMKTLW